MQTELKKQEARPCLARLVNDKNYENLKILFLDANKK